MYGLLIAIFYLAYISLGLPDSLLGAAWSSISVDTGAPIGMAGIVTMIISLSTIVSVLFTNVLVRKLGTGLLTALSVLLTAVSMFGFSRCTEFWQLCVWAIPYGLGAGAVDAALNNYAALHFSARHMCWLQCCWGIGVSVSPYIMGACLTGGWGWRGGYITVSIIQAVLTVIIFCSLPLWKKQGNVETESTKPKAETASILKNVNVWLILAMFFAVCSIEHTAMLWVSSYLEMYRGVTEGVAATLSTLFCSGIMLGRFLSGVFAKLGDKKLIRIGICFIVIGIGAICVPVDFVMFAGFVLIGLGTSPVYPSAIHATPSLFGDETSQQVVGLEMAFSYVGITFAPLLYGAIVESGQWTMPLYLGILAIILAVVTETMFYNLKKRKRRIKKKNNNQCI